MPSFDLNGPDEGIADALRSIGIDEWIIECETGTIVDPPNLTADQLAAIEAHREILTGHKVQMFLIASKHRWQSIVQS